MDPITAGLISGGGTIIQGLFGQSSAQASMDFQREVLQNRNQWAVADLKKAGLNPILAAGATNSSASGAQAHIDNPGEKAVNSAMSAKMADIAKDKLLSDMQVNQSIVNKNNADAQKAIAETNLTGPQYKKEVATIGKLDAETDSIGATADATRATIQNIIKQGDEIVARIQESRKRQENLEKEKELIKARIAETNTSADRNRYEALLTQKNTELAEIAKTTEFWEQDILRIEARLKSLGLPKAESDARYYNQPLFKFINENMFNPSKHWR